MYSHNDAYPGYMLDGEQVGCATAYYAEYVVLHGLFFGMEYGIWQIRGDR